MWTMDVVTELPRGRVAIGCCMKGFCISSPGRAVPGRKHSLYIKKKIMRVENNKIGSISSDALILDYSISKH